MKKYLLLIVAAMMLAITASPAISDDKDVGDDELLRKSVISEPNPFLFNSSFPLPTWMTRSTGYYFVDSDDDAPDYWRPNVDIVDTLFESNLWRRILQGPNLRDPQYWRDNPSEGLRYFRNPAVMTDSTDDAIAGPIPIGFNFYFNGLRFDSFYVSTNGIIALTNRRYFYDANGNRTVPPGAQTCYDPMSMDWFARNRNTPNGNGLDDPLADDYGYYYTVLGGNPTSQTAGIRARGGSLNQWGANNKAAVIAPFFGNLHLSQYNKDLNLPEDWGKVLFKRSNSADRLLIYFINASPVGTMATPYGTYSAPRDARPGDQNYTCVNAQVLLNKRDSSVTITYIRFEGIAIVGGRGVPAKTIFRYNMTVGVRGFARHVNYTGPNTGTYPWAAEYEQFTHYFSAYANPNVSYPFDNLAIKFKQWKNTVRVVDIQYLVRKQDINANLDYTVEVKGDKVKDYELLAGEERIGAIQPVAILQNLTNEIQGPQGVNFQRQELKFRARFRIVNQATQANIYNRLVPIDSTCLALPDDRTQECTGDKDVKIRFVEPDGDKWKELPFPGEQNYNGIPPYGYVKVNFPPFEPNEFVDNQIGRFRAYIIADPTDPTTNEGLGDEWPFDDTTFTQLFVMRRLENFNDDVSEFHIIGVTPMPSVMKWINIEGEVTSGDDVSFYPLPPRGEFQAANNENYRLNSPVIRLNRTKLDGNEPPTSPGGDELRSFPIDLRKWLGATISFSVQRNFKNDDWERGYGDQQLIGPEPRFVYNANPFDVWAYAAAASAVPDQLVLEFMQPSPDGIQHITNVIAKRWRNHPRRGGGLPVENMAAYLIYGGGGAMRGFLEDDKDSALVPPSGTRANGLRADLFDDGVDFEYKKISVIIPDTFINAPADGAKNFRFRIRVLATNDRKCLICIPDDDDPFFVDNIAITKREEIADVEMATVKVIWPYRVVPASQATKIPVRATVFNISSRNAAAFIIKVKIFESDRNGNVPANARPVYCRMEPLPQMKPGTGVEYPLPNWDARRTQRDSNQYYKLVGILKYPGGDLESKNDTNYSVFRLRFSDVFAYDPVDQPRNDVPDQVFTGINGRGLNMLAYSEGARGTVNGPSSAYDEVTWGGGYVGGSGSGQFAARFELTQTDTIKGYRAFLAPLNSSADEMSFAIYRDDGYAKPGGSPIAGTVMIRQRGLADGLSYPRFDEYLTYTLNRPVVLEPGRYWVAIGQMLMTGLELGASKSRSGFKTTSISIPLPVTTVAPVGGKGWHLYVDKNFRVKGIEERLETDNFFAYENSRGSNQWIQFAPKEGNVALAHLHHFGLTPIDGTTCTQTRGSWIPMIRPYFGKKVTGIDREFQECDDDIPVNLTDFFGNVRKNGIDLFWETASEINNRGYYVKRKVENSDAEWSSLGFVKGAGNSNTVNHYNYFDKDVVSGTTYNYRLRQVDYDGSQSCSSFSDIITLTYNGIGEATLEQNSPNPFNNVTVIRFTLTTEENTKLEILDIFGNVVKTIVNTTLSASSYQYEWDGMTNSNSLAPSGTYIYRLTAGDVIKTEKMSLIR